MQINYRDYYEDLKALAREKRAKHAVNTAAFGLREVRAVYKAEGIKIDYYPLTYKVKAIYMCADGDYSVAIQRKLPNAPKLFALVHELKHHYRDQEGLNGGIIFCGDANANELIEKGAEVFAAEFIYPEAEFVNDIQAKPVLAWTPEEIVHFKRNCKAIVSYRFLCKGLERIRLIQPKQYDDIQFQKLEDKIYGTPFHRR